MVWTLTNIAYLWLCTKEILFICLVSVLPCWKDRSAKQSPSKFIFIYWRITCFTSFSLLLNAGLCAKWGPWNFDNSLLLFHIGIRSHKSHRPFFYSSPSFEFLHYWSPLMVLYDENQASFGIYFGGLPVSWDLQ